MNRKHKGQMLIEIVVAIGIITLVLIGVTDLMTRSNKVVTFQKGQDEALSIVEKMLNDYRVQRDSNPQNFYDTVGSKIVDPCVPDKPYKCTVTVEKSTNVVGISIKAEWLDGGQTYSVTLSQNFATNITK